jgi:hypothetical protein
MIKLFNSPEFDKKIDTKKKLLIIPIILLIAGVFVLIKNK